MSRRGKDVKIILTPADGSSAEARTKAEVDQERAGAVDGLRKTRLGFAVWQVEDGVECGVITESADIGEIASFLVSVQMLHQQVASVFVAKLIDTGQGRIEPEE